MTNLLHVASHEEKIKAHLLREFGYVLDETSGDQWTTYNDHLIVIAPERRPRVYRKGCGGTFYEMEPVP